MTSATVRSLPLSSSLGIWLIRAYQKYISPSKGFVCAHRKLNQGESCSEFALRLIQEQGCLNTWQALPQRFAECRQATAQLKMLAMARPTDDLENDDVTGQAKQSSESGANPQKNNSSCDGIGDCLTLGAVGVDCANCADLGGLAACSCA